MGNAKLIVRRRSDAATRGVLEYGPFRWPCALGRGGIKSRKREGDGATPRGKFALLGGRYRLDRFQRLAAPLPLLPIKPLDGWCDAPGDRNYNRPVRHPYLASAEQLWREDGLYDVLVVLDYNIRPRGRGRGSAIFLHVAREGFEPTEGCVALRKRDLRLLLQRLKRGHVLVTD